MLKQAVLVYSYVDVMFQEILGTGKTICLANADKVPLQSLFGRRREKRRCLKLITGEKMV